MGGMVLAAWVVVGGTNQKHCVERREYSLHRSSATINRIIYSVFLCSLRQPRQKFKPDLGQIRGRLSVHVLQQQLQHGRGLGEYDYLHVGLWSRYSRERWAGRVKR